MNKLSYLVNMGIKASFLAYDFHGSCYKNPNSLLSSMVSL